eukprot:TRINITY_DN4721_c0_g1_i2.p1 TRINITY_DN4721_c0_g1~~TRINITY_DN4721_c0_g1_i2.p1  ORF type:complete len:151 (-),score=17.74 TRINITY_DN4721_c0_g1_i2:482-934(-)
MALYLRPRDLVLRLSFIRYCYARLPCSRSHILHHIREGFESSPSLEQRLTLLGFRVLLEVQGKMTTRSATTMAEIDHLLQEHKCAAPAIVHVAAGTLLQVRNSRKNLQHQLQFARSAIAAGGPDRYEGQLFQGQVLAVRGKHADAIACWR